MRCEVNCSKLHRWKISLEKSRPSPFLNSFHFNLPLLHNFLLGFSDRLRVVNSVKEGSPLEAGLNLSNSNSRFLFLPERFTHSLVDLVLLRYFIVIRLAVTAQHIFFLEVPTLQTLTISATTLSEIEETAFW